MQDLERDESLFSNKLSEKIKSAKTIEKQGLQIKKTVTIKKLHSIAAAADTRTPLFPGKLDGPSSFFNPSRRTEGGGEGCEGPAYHTAGHSQHQLRLHPAGRSLRATANSVPQQNNKPGTRWSSTITLFLLDKNYK